MVNFAEVRLDLGIDYGAVGGPRYKTTAITEGNGADQRNINWSQPLGRWQIGRGEDNPLDSEDLDYLQGFFLDRDGPEQGFRFKDWSDFKAKNQLLGTGNGVKTQFQLRKTYTAAGYSVNRPITKPVANTIQVYLGGVLQPSGWTLNLTNGLLTFTVPPAEGVEVRANFEFDVPVRLEGDSLDSRFESWQGAEGLFALQVLSVVEIRTPPGLPLPLDPVPQVLDHVIDLGYDYDTTGGPLLNTSIIPLGSGYERRDANWSDPRRRWNVGDRDLDDADLEYFISLYRVCRGPAVGFWYQDWQQGGVEVPCRFEQDALEIRFECTDGEESLFYLPGLPLVERIEAAAIVPTVCPIVEKSITFRDTDFDPADWELDTYEGGTPGSTVSGSQESSGGNPGSYRKITHNIVPGANTSSLHIHKEFEFIFSPNFVEIVSIGWKRDYKFFSATVPDFGQNEYIILKQGSNYYGTSGAIRDIAVSAWENREDSDFTESDFDLFGGIGNPDFSAGAEPIYLGFRRVNSAEVTFTNICGIDNLEITIVYREREC